MKVQNRYICDSCRHEVPPNAVFAVTFSTILPDGAYQVQREYHFCESCAPNVQLKYRKCEG